MSSLHKDDVAPAPSRCRRGYNSPVLTLYSTNPKLPASAPSGLRLVPLGRWAGRRFDLGNQAALEFAHHRAEVLDNLLPTVRIADRILRGGDRIRRDRQR